MDRTIPEDDWNQWVSNPVTRAYAEYLQETVDSSVNKMLNQDPGLSKDSLEEYAIKSMMLRSFIDGLGQAIDFESISEDIVIANEQEENQNEY